MPRPDLLDIAGAAGITLMAIGGWQIYPPLAFLVPGTALTTIAIIAACRG